VGENARERIKGVLGGHRKSKLYGRLDCPAAARALARGESYRRHRVFFADEKIAIAAGFRPCRACLPAQYARWKAGPQPGEPYPWKRRPTHRDVSAKRRRSRALVEGTQGRPQTPDGRYFVAPAPDQ
jgi:hypothetical protein